MLKRMFFCLALSASMQHVQAKMKVDHNKQITNQLTALKAKSHDDKLTSFNNIVRDIARTTKAGKTTYKPSVRDALYSAITKLKPEKGAKAKTAEINKIRNVISKASKLTIFSKPQKKALLKQAEKYASQVDGNLENDLYDKAQRLTKLESSKDKIKTAKQMLKDTKQLGKKKVKWKTKRKVYDSLVLLYKSLKKKPKYNKQLLALFNQAQKIVFFTKWQRDYFKNRIIVKLKLKLEQEDIEEHKDDVDEDDEDQDDKKDKKTQKKEGKRVRRSRYKRKSAWRTQFSERRAERKAAFDRSRRAKRNRRLYE